MNTYEARIFFKGINIVYTMCPSASTKEEAEALVRKIFEEYEPDLLIKRIKIRKINIDIDEFE